jgi:hypothetical protein
MVTSSGMALAWPVKMLASGQQPAAVTLVRIIHLQSNGVLADVRFRHTTCLSVSCMVQQHGKTGLFCGTEEDRALSDGWT